MAEVRRIGLDEVVRHFEELEDPRSSVNRKHPLVSVVVIAIMAVLGRSGCARLDPVPWVDSRAGASMDTAEGRPRPCGHGELTQANLGSQGRFHE